MPALKKHLLSGWLLLSVHAAAVLNPARTSALATLLAAQPQSRKIFLEPHLVSRLRLESGKFRFHGCRAERHDDHLHVQL